MFNIGYYKGQPTDYIIQYVNGRVVKEGPGLSFYYFRHNTQIAVIPVTTRDTNFVFNESTQNFQSVNIQGQFTYRILNANQAASLLNFVIDPRRKTYISEDPEHLAQRITNIIQMETRREIEVRTLEATLSASQQLAATVLGRVRDADLLEPLGVELLNLYFVAAKPTPEVAKALEAPYRESLLRLADEAIYKRRAAAVDEERKIKENERNSEIALEQQRQQLIALEGENAIQEAEFKGRAEEALATHRAAASERALAVYQTVDPRIVLALSMKEMAENADKIGNLTITSEMLASLLNTEAARPREPDNGNV